MRNRDGGNCGLRIADSGLKQSNPKSEIRNPKSKRGARRGVLLLVVLSMLVLFMLVGTAFLMTSNQSRTMMKEEGRAIRLNKDADKQLESGLLQILRDTENSTSAAHNHSLLRDEYGTDGFQAVVTAATYARQILPAKDPAYNQIMVPAHGPTNGQLIDIYIAPWGTKGPPTDVVQTPDVDESISSLTTKDVIKLDRDALGRPQRHLLSATRGYYNGQLLTIASGPAAGQTTRILDFEFVGSDQTIKDLQPKLFPSAYFRNGDPQIWRFRVMAFPKKDGTALTVTASAPPALTDLQGATFVVNGRAFSGTGVGYNPLAVFGQPRLSALVPVTIAGETYGAEVALMPNSAYVPLPGISSYVTPNPAADPFKNGTKGKAGAFTVINNPATPALWPYPSYVGPGGANEGYDAVDFQNIVLALQTVTPRSQGRVVQEGATGPIEVTDPALNPDKFLRLDLEDLPLPSFHRPDLINFWFHRMLNSDWLADAIPDPNERVKAILQPYDLTTGARSGWVPNDQIAAAITSLKRSISMRPIREDHPHFDGGNPLSVPAGFATTLTRKHKDPVTLKDAFDMAIPYWETCGPWDVDNDNDGVRDSIWVDLGDPILETEDGRRYKTMYSFLCVDLDSRLNVNAHGLADDILPPIDAKGKSLDNTRTSFFDPTFNNDPTKWVGNMAHDTAGSSLYSTLQLPRGLGYGPAETSLRPVFRAPLDSKLNPVYGSRSDANWPVDSYATLLSGRLTNDGKAINGRHGFDPNQNLSLKNVAATAGTNYQFQRIPNNEPAASPRQYTGEEATPSVAAQMKFFDYPWTFWNAATASTVRNYQSGFGTTPDLRGRYAVGLDYAGQPVYEVAKDVNPNTALLASTKWLPFNLLANNPYEIDLSSPKRRDSLATIFSDSAAAFNSSVDRSFIPTAADYKVGLNDDAAFSPTDLEKVLRAGDADAGVLPSRLWDVVDVFDPIKLAWYDPYRTAAYANDLLDPVSRAITAVSPGQMPSSQLLEGAQHLAAVNRHLVTTDSYDLTAANQTMPAWVSDFGADGAPGRRGQTNQTLNLAGTDDFQVIIGVPRARATIVDLLRYRVWLEARRYEMRRLNLTEMDVDRLSAANYTTFIKGITLRADAVVVVNSQLAQDLLAPEVIEGRRMDLNRPLGDGTDNNANGVVDDPLEAGDPFLDVNGNGKCDPGEPFIDLFGSGTYVGPGVPHPTQGNICDQLWAGLTGNGTLREQIVFDYTNGHAEPVHNLVAAAVKSAFGQVPHGVRNLESQGRQLFARHLYCLMLLLTDENYIAPWDENDGQFTTWMTNERNKLIAAFPSMNPGEADAIIKRKATCRMIAQWAVNCVDMRDADAIMTSFEYTDNPWFGWGVWDDIWAKDPATWPTSITDPKFPTMIPLDGDVATDENKGEVIDWSIVSKNTTPGGTPSNANTKKLTALPTANVPTNPLDQTRGEVWGAERPELLITEALAFHDRRTEDVPSNDSNGHGEMRKYDKTRKPGSYGMDPNYTYYNQPNPSQSLRPRGSLFVEVYNPWSPQAQLPAEIYSPFDVSTGYTYDSTKPRLGVDLGRLSNLAWDDIKGQLTSAPTQVLPDPANPAIAKTSIKRSPVWRMIAVEEWPDSRNADELDDVHLDKLDPSSCIIDPATGQIKPNTGKPYKFPGPKEPQRNKDIAAKVKAWTPSAMDPVPPFRPTDPDFDPLFANNMLQVQTAIPADPTQKITTTYLVGTAYGKGGRLGMQIGTTNDNTNQPTMNGEPKNQFYVSYPNIEREFYFTTDKSPMAVTDIRQLDLTEDYDYSPSKFRIRIPDRSVHIRYPSTASGQPKAAQTQKFIDLHLELGPRADQTTFVNKNAAVISPIMPGRYCVIGSAGTNYNYDPTDPAKPKNQIYTTTVGRLNLSSVGTGWNTDDLQHDPFQTRRIEMHPMTARGISEPTKQQLLVASNGGDPNDDQPSVATVNNQTVIGYDPTTKEIGRDNELIYDNSPGGGKKVKNVVSEDTNKNLHADYYQPCVTIPVAGMNISEPAWGYAAREYEAAVDELEIMRAGGKARSSTPQLATFRTKPNSGIKDYEGRYYSDLGGQGAVTSYAAPFDGYKEKPIALELVRTGTTANYRTIHLQRLANPLLPWNPESKLANGEPNPEWRPNMPINPYRTIDSSSVNLTAFNGVSKVEANYAQVDRPKQQQELFQLRPWEDSNTEQSDYVTKTFVTGGQVWDFRSQERGWWSRLNVLGSVASPAANVPQRVVWGQEPPMVKLKQTNFTLFDLIPSRQMTMRSSSKEIPTSPVNVMTEQNILDSRVNMVMQHTLGFGNRSLGLLYDSKGAKQANFPSNTFKSSSAAPIPAAVGAPASCYYTWDNDGTKPYSEVENSMVRFKVDSTDPWLAWDDRPFVSAEELLKVPATSQSQMLRQYSTIDSGAPAANRPNPYGLASLGAKPTPANGYFMVPNATRWKVMQAPFGQLANVFAASGAMCDVVRDTDLPPTLIPSGYNVRGVPVRFATSGATAGTPILPDDPTKEGDVQPFGGPNFSRILDYVQVPSRFVGTDTMLNAETFNDVPGVTDTVGLDITSSADPRYNFQPPFNKVSRERDPGRVNLNTVIGRRAVENGVPHIWSEVFDGIMNRVRDTNPSNSQISHFGPAWRDVALSRRGYAQFDALGNLIDKPLDKPASDPTAKPVPTAPPDTLQLGLNNNFPTFFSNPFRSSDAGDLVPLDQMIQRGVDASLERVHPRNRGSIIDASGAKYDSVWGGAWPAGFSAFFDARDAGFGNDGISVRPNGAIPNTALLLDPSVFGQRDLLPLFSESRNQPFADTDRNPYMMYEPMSRLGNLVTNRSGCYAVWITVGYFEVEPAPSWSDSNVQAHFGGDLNLYNRVYPDGYMLGKELGSETGDVKRPRGFYIIDRTEEVGFKPGEDLNVEKTIRLRRRIE